MDALLSSLPVLAAFVVAIAITLLFASLRNRQQRQHYESQISSLNNLIAEYKQRTDALDEELAEYRERLFNNQTQLGELSHRASMIVPMQEELKEFKQQCREEQRINADLSARLQSQQAQFDEANKASTEKLALMEAAEKRLQAQFENLANRIFEQKSERFTQMNNTGMNALLEPLKLQIDTFRKQMASSIVVKGRSGHHLKPKFCR